MYPFESISQVRTLLLFFFYQKVFWQAYLEEDLTRSLFFYPQASPLKRKIDYRPLANSSFPNLEHRVSRLRLKSCNLNLSPNAFAQIGNLFSSIAITVCMTHFSTTHCLVFWFTSFICSFIQHMLNEEYLIRIRWVRQRFWPSRAYSSYISLPQKMTSSWKKSTSSFSHMLIQPTAQRHIHCSPQNTPAILDQWRKGSARRERGWTCLSALALPLHPNKCLKKKSGPDIKSLHLPQIKS